MRVLVAAIGGILIAFTATATAHASPAPGDYEKMIDKAWRKLEPVIEKHNQVAAELAQKKKNVAKLNGQIRPLQLRVDLAMSRVSSYSVAAYKGRQASMLEALMSNVSPDALADELSMLNAMARTERAQVKDVIKLKSQLDDKKRPIDAMVADLSKQEKDLADQQKTINADIKRFDKMRREAYGSGGGTGSLRPVACPLSYDGSAGARAAKVACNQISKPYVWATAGPDTFDCSGLMEYAWAQEGVSLQHYTVWQFNETSRVSRSNLHVGDLVFYYPDNSHVGMYVGGDWIVHAPTAGDVVRMAKLDHAPIYGYGRPH